jgi:hypothetical protein
MIDNLRIGDSEREAAVAALSEHFTAGRLTQDEHEERVAAAWSARTSADLTPLFTDLPAPHGTPTGISAEPWSRLRPARRRGWPGVAPAPVIVLLVALAVFGQLPWFVAVVAVWLWCVRRSSGHWHYSARTRWRSSDPSHRW